MTDTRARILEVAEAVYQKEGAEALSMRRVADELGVSATALYRHYAGKDELLDAIAERGFEQLAAAFRRATSSGTSRAKLEALVNAFRAFALRRPAVFDLMFFSRRKGARQYPGDFAGASPTGAVLVAFLDELGVDDPLEVGLLLWAEAQGLISLHRAGRFESDAAFCRAWDGCFARLFEAILPLRH